MSCVSFRRVYRADRCVGVAKLCFYVVKWRLWHSQRHSAFISFVKMQWSWNDPSKTRMNLWVFFQTSGTCSDSHVKRTRILSCFLVNNSARGFAVKMRSNWAPSFRNASKTTYFYEFKLNCMHLILKWDCWAWPGPDLSHSQALWPSFAGLVYLFVVFIVQIAVWAWQNYVFTS